MTLISLPITYFNFIYIFFSFFFIVIFVGGGLLLRKFIFLALLLRYFFGMFLITEFFIFLFFFIEPESFFSYSSTFGDFSFTLSFFDEFVFVVMVGYLFLVLVFTGKSNQTFFFYKNVWLWLVFFFTFLILLVTRHLTGLFFCLELFSLLSLIILAHNNYGRAFNLSVIQYFLFNCLLTGIFSFCLLWSYNYVNTGDYVQLFYFISCGNFAYVFVAGIFLVLLAKLGFAPVHLVFFDVYSSLDWGTFGLIANLAKLVLFITAARIWQVLHIFPSSFFLWTLIILTLFIGALGPFYAFTLRRILLYGSLFTSGVGLVFLALNCVGLAVSYVFFYTIFSSAVILMFIRIENAASVTLVRLDSLVHSCFAGPEKYIFVIYLFVLAGFPPFVLFWFKVYAYGLLLNAAGFLFFVLFLFLFAVTTYAYLRICKFLLFQAPSFQGGDLPGPGIFYYGLFFYFAFGTMYYWLEVIFKNSWY